MNTITVLATVIVSASEDADTVYDLTKAIFSHEKEIAKENARGEELNLDTATSITTVPYHEGAARYYKEQGYPVNTEE